MSFPGGKSRSFVQILHKRCSEKNKQTNPPPLYSVIQSSELLFYAGSSVLLYLGRPTVVLSLLFFFLSHLVFLASFLSALLYIYRFSVFFAVHCPFISLMSATHFYFILLCCNVSLVVFHLGEYMCGCSIVNLAVISLNVECS